MHGKKDTLSLVTSDVINEPSLLPPLPPDEPGKEEQPLAEIPAEFTGEGALSKDELDAWDEQADPFEQRHLPTSIEAAPIEEADIQRAFAQRETHIMSNAPLSPLPFSPARASRWSVGFRSLKSRPRYYLVVALVFGLILLLLLDGILFLVNVIHSHSPASLSNTLSNPVLTVNPAMTHSDQIVTLHLTHFSSSAQVLLTRDMQQPVRTDSGVSLIKVGSDGRADVHILVEDNWGAGPHLLLTEDIHSHYVASVSLQVISDFPAPLPRLTVGTQDEPNGLKNPLNFGADIPEANSIQSLLLHNIGGSWISWQATSNQPWLTLAPQQGVFQQSQGVFVAVSRLHLTPGYHQGTITLISNAGKPVLIQAAVTVLPSPKSTSALLAVEPALLSFTATDGAGNPAAQSLTISNPGTQPLNWSLTTSVPQDLSGNQDTGSWLHTDTTSGAVAPGGTARIQVTAQSQQLLPGEYGGLLLFTINGDPLNALQPVAIALTVQPRCGVISNPGSVSLAITTGQQATLNQPLDIGTTPGCAEVTNWQAFSQASWLKMTPTSGQLQPGIPVKGNLLFDTDALTPGVYTTSLDLLTEMRSQTLMIQVTILSSSATQPGKTTGSSTPASGTSNGTPVSTSPGSGTPVTTPSPVPSSTVAPGTPTPTPAPGTPTPASQPCSLQVTPARLAFIGTLLQANPPAQTIALSVTGNCSQPVSWNASVDAASQGWLHLGAASGVIGKGGSLLVVQVNTSGKLLGTYSGQIALTASDSGVAMQGSPQAVSVSLTVVL